MTDREVIQELKMLRNDASEYIPEAVSTVEALDKAIKALEIQRWIPVSERLPKEDEWVLITFNDGIDDGTEIALLDDDGWCYSSVGNDDWIAEHPPVAWMPLPLPYKECDTDEHN